MHAEARVPQDDGRPSAEGGLPGGRGASIASIRYMKLIVVALDASPRAPDVLHSAVELAEQTCAKLLLLRAVGLPTDIPPEALAIVPEQLPDVLTRKARESLQAL